MFQKKGQNWSLELIIVISVFTIIVILSFFYMSFLQQEDTSNVMRSSDRIMSSVENDVRLIRNNEIDSFTLSDLEGKSSEELAELFGVSGDVCISFRDLDGNLIVLNNGNLTIGANDDFVCGG